ncbi:hypothetical protein ISS08_01465 [Candidatus Pacearchaeota archaeon]|nr:hypothetical protein [Candidatus Pacearchaeota archaeon]
MLKIKSKKVVVYSLIALVCLILTFTIDWFFIIPAVILWHANKKELAKK